MSLPSSQLGVFIKSSDPTYAVERHPVPSPGPGEALIKIEAVAINQTDCASKPSSIIIIFIVDIGLLGS